MQNISLIQAVFGLAMLTLGRRLYWLFVAGIGFAIGFSLASRFLVDSTIWTLLIVGLVVGLLAGLAAMLMNRLVMGIAGFLVGGFLAIKLLEFISLTTNPPSWLVFLIGGALCALLVAILFDWALILLTSLVGAGLLVQLFNTSDRLSLLLIAVLLGIGLFIQGRILLRK
jgi:Domain of unknown function (DUF4203)